MTDQTEPTPDPTDPGPDDTQDPVNDIIEEQDHEFSREEMLALFDDPTADAEDEGGVADAGDDTPLEPAAEEVQEETEPTPEPEPEPAAAQSPYVEFAGRQYPVDQVGQLIQWAESLTAEQWAALQGQSTPEPDPEPVIAPPSDEEVVDPATLNYVQQKFAELEQRQSIFEQQQAAAQAQLAAQRDAELNAAVDQARRGVAEKYGLTDIEAQRLLEVANNTPAAIATVQTADLNSDPVGTFAQALETAYWITPEFRDRAIQSQATTLAAELGVQSSLEERKQLQAGLVGQGAATPRVTTPAPQTEEEHLAEAVRIARESMNIN